MGAPTKFAVDLKSRTEAVERLIVDEQRALLHLIGKMSSVPLELFFGADGLPPCAGRTLRRNRDRIN